jgi:hypothetical protein
MGAAETAVLGETNATVRGKLTRFELANRCFDEATKFRLLFTKRSSLRPMHSNLSDGRHGQGRLVAATESKWSLIAVRLVRRTGERLQ